MELLQLRYFQAVARHNHISRVAEQMNVSQPSVSKAIAKLEDELGVKLFDRVGGHIELNPAGADFLKRVTAALGELDAGVEDLQSRSRDSRRLVRILMNSGHRIIWDLLHDYQLLEPNTRFELMEKPANLSEASFDLIFCTENDPDAVKYEAVPVLDREILLIVSVSHRLAARRSVNVDDLKSEIYLQSGDALFPQHVKLAMSATENYAGIIGWQPAVVTRIVSKFQMWQLLSSNSGVTLCPRASLDSILIPGLIALPVGPAGFIQRLCLGKNPRHPLLEAASQFHAYAAARYSETHAGTSDPAAAGKSRS